MWLVGLLSAALMVMVAAPLSAQSDEAFIQYRQKVMGSQGANMGAIGDILKHQLPLTENIAGHARNIEVTAGLIAAAFKKNISAGATDAKAAIWQNWDEFADMAKNTADRPPPWPPRHRAGTCPASVRP
jgi:cytochrome c556